MKIFQDKYNRWMRLVWRGITVVRLQDNKGQNYIVRNEDLFDILPMPKVKGFLNGNYVKQIAYTAESNMILN